MALIANEGDGFKSLRLINSKANVVTTLESPFLKDMQHYSAVVRNFYTNSVPSLFPEDFKLLEIFDKREMGEELPYYDVGVFYGAVVDRFRLIIKRDECHNMLDFVKRIRPERKFPSKDALVAQIALDIEAAREVLSELEAEPPRD